MTNRSTQTRSHLSVFHTPTWGLHEHITADMSKYIGQAGGLFDNWSQHQPASQNEDRVFLCQPTPGPYARRP